MRKVRVEYFWQFEEISQTANFFDTNALIELEKFLAKEPVEQG